MLLGLVGWQLAWLPIDMYDAGGGLARAQFIAGAFLPWLAREGAVQCSGHWAVAHWLSASPQRVAWQVRRRSARNGIGKDSRPRKLACGLDGGDGPRPRPSGPRRTRTARAMGTGWDGTVAHSNSMQRCWSTRAARLHSHSPLTAGFCRTTADEQQLVSGVWWSSMQRCCHSRSFL